jgi:hypothetical protein
MAFQTTEKLIEEAKTLGVELTGKETYKELTILVSDAKKANKEAGEGENKEEENKGKANTGKNPEKMRIVWLKNRAYINATQRVDAGVYMLAVSEIPERLVKLPASACEVLPSEVKSRKIAEIARWSGINPDGLDDDEILGKVLSFELIPR